MRQVLSLIRAVTMLMVVGCAPVATAAGNPDPAVSTPSIDPKRLIRIEGTIGGQVLRDAQKLLNLSDGSTKPVSVLINSFGGEVLSGLQFVSAMNIAQTRGVKIHCYVSNVAMSMAFFILTHCDTRYALQYSLFLWHPAKAGLLGSFTSRELRNISDDLAQLENPLILDMIKRTRIEEKKFRKHYEAETVWTTESLQDVAPGFVRTLDDFGDLSNLFGGLEH